MSYFTCEVIQLGKIGKHPSADNLSITNVFDFPVIFRTGQFNTGDLAVYIPVESVVPLDRPEFAFLANPEKPRKTERIKAKKLRNIFSMGLLVPAPSGSVVGQNVAEQLGVVKYEEPIKLTTFGDAERDPGFAPYYDLQNFRRYSHLFITGEDVRVCEKLHGCLWRDTLINMADGTKKKISKIKKGEEVLGRNERGEICPTKVLNVFRNGPSTEWMTINSLRTGRLCGSAKLAVTCTPNHRFWSAKHNDYVPASTLKKGDKITFLKTDISLTPIQEQVLLGKMLGDGSLSRTNSRRSAAVVYGHSAEDREYLEWTAKALGNLNLDTREEYISGYGSKCCRTSTLYLGEILEKFKSMLDSERTKIVPKWVANKLTPLAIAFWYMDDGSLSDHNDQEDRANFAVCAFTEEDCKVLQKGLKKFDINSVYYKADGYSRLRLNADDADKLFLLIAPYIPPVMQRKLPERYRGHPGWLPETHYRDEAYLTEIEITDIRYNTRPKDTKYDLETETHNFFASGVLVHNSNGMWIFRDNRLWCRSHGEYKRRPDEGAKGNLWWAIAQKYDLESRLQKIPNMAVFGEVFGSNVQDLSYGAQNGEIFMRAFDVFDTSAGRWMEYDEAKQLVESVGLTWVPELFRGPYTSEVAHQCAVGNSTIANNIREGCVIRPSTMRYEQEIGTRLVLKLVGEQYLTRKGGTEHH